MRDILWDYQLSPTTWAYIGSLMIIGIYFKFNRVWSVRNLDLLGLIALGPGLLLIWHGPEYEKAGYDWLFIIGLFFLVRLLADTIMVRRPMLEPNLTAGGLTFSCLALLVFLTTNVITGKVPEGELASAHWADQIRHRQDMPDTADLELHGPGYPLFYLVAGGVTNPFAHHGGDEQSEATERAALEATARTAAILGQIALLLGMVLVGYRHFDNLQTGMAAGLLYLLLPYSQLTTNYVDHVVPAALMVWAVQCYRRPILAGLLLGMASGAVYYPLFLLPLWSGFYWRRGLLRFLGGFAVALLVMTGSLAFTCADLHGFLDRLREMYGWTTLMPRNVNGFWEFHEQAFRLPVMVTFMVLSVGFALWPPQKNLGTLLSCSAAVMLGTQFWHPQSGGIYVAWYLPLLLLTIFRPNLEDRVAVKTVRDFPWSLRRRRAPAPAPAPAS